jgi:hypothetical protein
VNFLLQGFKYHEVSFLLQGFKYHKVIMPYECLAKYRQVNDKIVQHFLHDVHIISLLEEYMIMYKVVNKWITNTIQMKLEDSNGTIT